MGGGGDTKEDVGVMGIDLSALEAAVKSGRSIAAAVSGTGEAGDFLSLQPLLSLGRCTGPPAFWKA